MIVLPQSIHLMLEIIWNYTKLLLVSSWFCAKFNHLESRD